MVMKTRRISKGGHLSIPATVRRRWATSTVVLDDQGDRIVIEPASDDPTAAAFGAMRAQLAGVDLAEMRRYAREDDRIAEERRVRRTR
jgi:hypothetical protein